MTSADDDEERGVRREGAAEASRRPQPGGGHPRRGDRRPVFNDGAGAARGGERRGGRGKARPASGEARVRSDRPAREPTGDDSRSNRARTRDEAQERAQPFRPPRKAPPRRPPLPEERPVIPRDAWRDLRATVPAGVLDDVVKAVGTAADALERGDTGGATQLLVWAKSVASRTATIREALGVTHYAAGKYADAHSELLTYRRLSGSQDQNHVLADCARALGRPEKVREYVDQMLAADVDPDRKAEALIVLAGTRADAGDLEGALQVLRRASLDPEHVQPWHPRLWYVAGDICERLGRGDQAREYFEAILAVDEEFGDVEERLARLAQ